MKLLNKLKLIFNGLKSSIKRFPVTVILSTALTIFLIYLNEASLNENSREITVNISLILGLGVLLSFVINLVLENLNDKDKIKYVISYGLGTVILVLYYFFLLNNLDQGTIIRYSGTVLFLVLVSLYIQRLRGNKNYEYYVMNIIYNSALTLIYSFVLYFGIVAILFALDNLLDIRIRGELYYYTFLIVFLIFGVSLFLSKFPYRDKSYKNVEYSNPLKILLTYIVIPLIIIYTFILYIYFGKILITRQWPKGLVSHLVLWYSAISVGVIFLITPVIEENKVLKSFKSKFPKIILPILIMMFVSVGKRIGQYGVTENRYFVLVLGLWVFGIMLYFSIRKSKDNIIIPVTLSIIILNSVYGPLSSFQISKYSQNQRFENILEKNNMIVNGEIVPSENISSEDKKEINNIITYFNKNHELKDIKVLPDKFKTSSLKDLMGFAYVPYNPYGYNANIHIFYGSYNLNKPIDIKGFDYYTLIRSWDNNPIEVEELSVKYEDSSNILKISKEGKILVEQDIKEFVNEIHQKKLSEGDRSEKFVVQPEDLIYIKSYNEGNDKVQLKFIFNNVNLSLDMDDNLELESLEFILLINIE